MKKTLLFVILIMTSISMISQVKLHPDLSADTSIEYYEISPDGNTVVYIADRDTDNVFELYSVPIIGGTNTKLSGTMVADGDVSFGSGKRFQFSPNGQTVVYLADQDINGTPELYAVPTGGGSVVKLNGTLAGADGVRGFQISPNGQFVVYVADELDNFDDELYSVPIGGGTSTKISQADLGIGDVFSTFQISADSQWVVYVANADDSSDNEIYSVPIEGGTINKLNGTLVSGGDVLFNKFYISSDSQYVVYVADQDTNFVEEVYSTPIGGGTSVKLNEALPTNNDDVDRVFLSPDGQWVVYVAGNFANQDYEIFSVPTAGGTVNNLSPAEIDNDFDASLRNSVIISPNSGGVVYLVNTTNFSTLIPEAFVTPIDGSQTPTNISPWATDDADRTGASSVNPSAGMVRISFYFSPYTGELTAAFLADNEVPGRLSLFTLELSIFDFFRTASQNDQAIRLNGELVAGGDVTDFIVSPDGANILYRADQDVNDDFELYTVPSNGSGFIHKLNGQLTPGGDVIFDRTTGNASSFEGIQMSSDGARVVYLADQDTDGIFELYSVDYQNVLSTQNITDLEIQLFNDDNGNIHIKGIDNGKTTVEVYSILGSRLFQTSFEANGNNVIPTSNISNGVYIVRVTNENNQSISKKMVFTR